MLLLTGTALRTREVILWLWRRKGRPTTYEKAVGLRPIHDPISTWSEPRASLVPLPSLMFRTVAAAEGGLGLRRGWLWWQEEESTQKAASPQYTAGQARHGPGRGPPLSCCSQGIGVIIFKAKLLLCTLGWNEIQLDSSYDILIYFIRVWNRNPKK